MALGLQRGSVKLVPHSGEWQKRFEEEKARIVSCLRGRIATVEHVGSTAIPGVPAKPILDIAIGIPEIGDVWEYVEAFERVGYEYRGDRGGSEDHALAKGPEGSRTHYAHIVSLDGSKWKEYVQFRDYLRTHEEMRRKYAVLKSGLAERYASNRHLYTEGKQEFIGQVIEMARKESEG